MINAKQAYAMFKQMKQNPPIIELAENDDAYTAYVFDNEGIVFINKNDGKIWHQEVHNVVDRLKYSNGEKQIYLSELFDDFMKFYEFHNEDLARLYAQAWNQSYYANNEQNPEEFYAFEQDFIRIKERWSSIEKYLYQQIVDIMEQENYTYPKVVEEHKEDSYLRVKPFMVKNGYTTSDTERIWAKSK